MVVRNIQVGSRRFLIWTDEKVDIVCVCTVKEKRVVEAAAPTTATFVVAWQTLARVQTPRDRACHGHPPNRSCSKNVVVGVGVGGRATLGEPCWSSMTRGRSATESTESKKNCRRPFRHSFPSWMELVERLLEPPER